MTSRRAVLGPLLRSLATLGLLGLLLSCNFDAAFRRYCEGNSKCPQDLADSGPDAQAGPDAVPDAAPAVPDAEPDGPPPDLLSFPLPRACDPPSVVCETGEFCNRMAKGCLRICSGAGECPEGLVCIEQHDPKGAQRTCQCTRESCNRLGSDVICNGDDLLCQRACGSDQDCAGYETPRSCEISTGTCRPLDFANCRSSNECPSVKPRCNLETNRCESCLGPSDCIGRPDGRTQCSLDGSCEPPM